MLWSIDSCQNRVSADQCYMYHGLRCTIYFTEVFQSYPLTADIVFQLIPGSGQFFSERIQFAIFK